MTQKPVDVAVAIIGAGPVGLTIANLLGTYGISACVLEQGETLIDYPRAVGMDDECLRVFQAAGVVNDVLPHTIPNQWLRFLTSGGRCFASIEPRSEEFGWPRRSGFIQPLVDLALLHGVDRFADISVKFGARLTNFEQDESGVTLGYEGRDRVARSMRTHFLIGADGGRSEVRKTLGIGFEGATDDTKWIVVDIANDPIGTPNAYLHCDPRRPTVSIGLPHGIRRFEFMIFRGEDEAVMATPDHLTSLMRPYIAHPTALTIIRARVYTHHARLATHFGKGRAFIAGDAAHLMPVWQGQGYNSGIRDANNLAWKLAAVCRGTTQQTLLQTYEEERRDHAKAMISISVLAGKLFSPTNPALARLRDAATLLLNALPAAKRYILQMRFKPMPQYTRGAIATAANPTKSSPVGKLFIQPLVITPEDSTPRRLDSVLGEWFSIVSWGSDPTRSMDAPTRAFWDRVGATYFAVKPPSQMPYTADIGDGTRVIGDAKGLLKEWFDRNAGSIVILRPDRFVAALTSPQSLCGDSERLAEALCAS